ncbi:MAG: ATP synthase F1 subunit delta [Bacteroidales bacterium]|jgi:F-type H+-transporting ATPase subunit delta|nr:ATP synthase F1 subunit delta [Bacteroidales bacterium]
MDNSIATRYATAFYDEAEKQGLTAAVQADIDLLQAVFRQNSDLETLLQSPVIEDDRKIAALSATFADAVTPLTMNFLKLLVHNRRAFFLESICKDFLKRLRKRHDVRKVVLTTAIALDAERYEQIGRRLEASLGGKIELHRRVNPALIGGLSLRVDDDRLLDANIVAQLAGIKRQLLTVN